MAKGSMVDMFYLLVFFLIFGMMILTAAYLSDSILPQLTNIFGSGEATTITNTVKGTFRIMDYLFLGMFFILSVIPIIFAFLVKTHPIFFIINLLLLFIYFLIAPSISNVMHDFWVNPEFAQYAEGGGGSFTFPIMTRIFQNLPLITIGMSVILSIASFAKGGE